jgi:hypothetical protein
VKPTCLAVALLALVACSSADIDNKEAVREAMLEYINANSASTGLDPDRMDIAIDAVVFERDVARATVSYKVKGTDTGMQQNYTLDRKGNKWVARKPEGAGAAHNLPEAEPAIPPNHPPLPGK